MARGPCRALGDATAIGGPGLRSLDLVALLVATRLTTSQRSLAFLGTGAVTD